MGDAIKTVVAFAFLGMLLLVLGAIFRFSIISSWKTRGERNRLRKPDIRGLEALCGFRPPDELVAFYKDAPIVDRNELTLLDNSRVPPQEWSISGFIPLALVDTREWRKITRVPGIPIASDADKGVYWIDRMGTIRLSSPNVDGREILVASNITAFAELQVKPESDNES